MRFSSEWRVAPIAVAAALSWLASVPAVRAQSPTAEQLNVLQSLPQEQRDAILQQMGGQTGAAPASAASQANSQIVFTNPNADGQDSTEIRSSVTSAPPRDAKIKGFEEVLLNISIPLPSEKRSVTDEKRLDELRSRILAANPYELTEAGILRLPGFAPIALAGLTNSEAQKRVSIEPQLREFKVSLTLLRVDAQGPRALKPFGYDMFRAAATANVPGTDIPVPSEYRVGPGDVFDVQLYGQQSKTYSLPVGRDGTIAFPDLGPISVGGLQYGDTQNILEKRVRQQLIGTQVRVRLGELRSMRILVVGDAEKPGSYLVSSLAGVTNALFASGGVKPIGSLRAIEVKRENRLLRRVDLYDVLLHGDTASDGTLQTGDVVFVPPVGPTVGVVGEVRRPAVYELAKERALSDVIALAGGLSPQADTSVVTIERVGVGAERTALDVDLGSAAGAATLVRSGDIVNVRAIRPVVDNAINLEGHVFQPGVFAWHNGLRLTDVIRSMDDLRPRADSHYVFVRREESGSRRLSVVSADLESALASRGSAVDIPLQARDRIVVFDLDTPRDRVIDPILDAIQRQSRPEDLAGVVYVDGRVNAAGAYPLEPSMRVSDLLRAAGGLQDAAYVNDAELSRYRVVDGERRTVDIRQIDVAAIRKGDLAADEPLKPYDLLSIKLTPDWGRQEKIELLGEVRFPGTYLIRRSETLSSVLARAGGLTEVAFPQGAVFTREELKLREREQLDRLASRLQADLATLSVQSAQTSPGNTQALSVGQGLLDQLRQTKPVGRLVIDISDVTSNGPHHLSDVTLRNGDKLVVPRATEEVSVLGEVQNPTSHLFRAGLTRDSVIDLSGGTTAHADRKRTYVVRANGSVIARSSGWLGSSDIALRPGDSVVVPVDAEKMRPLPMWTAVTSIIYNLAIAATAVARF